MHETEYQALERCLRGKGYSFSYVEISEFNGLTTPFQSPIIVYEGTEKARIIGRSDIINGKVMSSSATWTRKIHK